MTDPTRKDAETETTTQDAAPEAPEPSPEERAPQENPPVGGDVGAILVQENPDTPETNAESAEETPEDELPAQDTPEDEPPAPEEMQMGIGLMEEAVYLDDVAAGPLPEDPEEEKPTEAPKETTPAPSEPEHIVSVEPRVSVESATDRLEEILNGLADLAREQGMRTISSEVTSDRLPALQEGRVTVVVLGEFNHGKSSILNALLGEEVLPTGITPTTAQITHIKYANRPRAIIQYDAHDRKTVKLSELASVVASEQRVEPQYVEVGFPSEVLRDNLVLVDTPGVNDISRQRVEVTYGYVPRADVILYVLDSNQVLKKSEITFIRDRLLRGNRDRLIFVLGKVDSLTDDERQEVEDYAREKLGEMLGSVELYPVSARRAMEGGDEGFDIFRKRLLGYLKDRKAYILIDSGVSGGLRIAGMLQQNLAIKRSGYALDSTELQERVDAVRARLSNARRAIYENLDLIDETTGGLKSTVKHNLREFTERFLEALPEEVDRASVDDIKNHLPDWIRDTFKSWVETQGSVIARELESLAEQVIETTNANLKEAVEDMQEHFGVNGNALNLEVDTLTYDVGVYALGTAGISIALFGGVMVGGLMLLAAPVLAIVVKDKVEEKTRALAKEQGQQAIEQAGSRLEAELIKIIEDYGDKLKTFVESAGARLYQQIDEALQQVVRETEASNADRAALDEAARTSLDRVDALADELRAVRANLLR